MMVFMLLILLRVRRVEDFSIRLLKRQGRAGAAADEVAVNELLVLKESA
jgi:hypothetical protein